MPKEDLIECTKCKKRVQKRSLSRHNREVHQPERRCRCRDCGVSFARSTDLDRHRKSCKERQLRHAREEEQKRVAHCQMVRVEEEACGGAVASVTQERQPPVTPSAAVEGGTSRGGFLLGMPFLGHL